MVLDHSSSMSAPVRKFGKETCLDVLKKSCKKTAEMLQLGDQLTMFIFSEKSRMILKPVVITGGSDKVKIKDAIDDINYGGGTHMSTSLREMLKIRKKGSFISRAFIFTDGEVNIPSEKREEDKCLKLAIESKKNGIPFWVYGTGISYNEKFLRRLAERSGGHFEHISDPAKMVTLFQNQARFFKEIAVTNVELTLEALPGVVFRKISQVIPDIANFGKFQPDYFSRTIPDIDRARGAAILIKMEVAPQLLGVFPLAEAKIRYDVPVMSLRAVEQEVAISVNFTNDQSLIKQNQKVIEVTTLQSAHDLTTQAAEKADTGKVETAIIMMNQAAGLYRQAGADDMATKLMTLSNTLQQQGSITGQNINTRRTLTSDSSQMITRRLTSLPASTFRREIRRK